MRRLILILISMVIQVSLCLAQSNALDPSTQSILQSITSAVATLSGDDSIAAGTYQFKNDTSPDVDLDMYKYVGEFSLGDSDAQFVPLLELAPAYLKFEQVEPDNSMKSEIESWAIGVGTGVRMQFLDSKLIVTPRLKIEYADVDFDFSSNTFDVSEVNSEIPRFDVWSFLPSTEVKYQDVVTQGGASLAFKTKLTFVYNESKASRDSVADSYSRSWIWRNTLLWEQPVTIGSDDSVRLRPNIARVDIRGAARDGFEFNNFYEIGADLVSKKIAPEVFNEFGVGITYVYESEFQGWVLGILAKLA
ncbi:MAG: Solitary outer membrane autotransporter beta-barrel domain [Bdellovibrionales bacterium]|nr:Solitary outer membrane autotransporter beta-barrel domain [Bdellovibrionales bacterium]